MTDSEKNKCHAIIHSFAAASGAGNFIPAPGAGIAVDIGCMASMCMSLAAVFANAPTDAVKEGILVAAMKRLLTKQALKELAKQPKKKAAKETAKFLAKHIIKQMSVKCAAKEGAKMIPFIGALIASTLSVTMIESEGWRLAYAMDAARKELDSAPKELAA